MARRMALLCLFLSLLSPVLAQDAATAIPTGEKILAWVGPGETPTPQPKATPGQLVFLTGDGTLETVMDLPANITHALPCGDAATSPNGEYLAVFVGRDTGELYVMRGTQVPMVRMRERINVMTCAGNGTFSFAPDSTRFAYLDYPDDYNTASSPTTRLIVQESATGTELENFEESAAFTWYQTGVAYVTFFKNAQNQATEASINVWDGARDREVVARAADDGCYYTSASLAALPDGRMAAVLSIRCDAAGRSVWQLYTVDAANRSMTLVGEGETRGRFFPFSRTNSLFIAPDGSSAFFTVPDGVSNETVGMNVGALVSPTITPLFPNNGIMPRISRLSYEGGNHVSVMSADGRLLALVRNSADGDASVVMIDLSAPDLPPIEISAGDRGNTISELLFTPDSTQLIYVAGNETSAVYVLDTLTGAEERLNRGRYAQGVISPDGTKAALINRESYSDQKPPYDTLVILDLVEGFETTVFTGGIVQDSRITDQQFIYPLSWRRSLP